MMGKKVSPRRVVFIYNVHELHCLENKVTVLITKVIPDAHANTHTHTHARGSQEYSPISMEVSISVVIITIKQLVWTEDEMAEWHHRLDGHESE